MAPGLEGARVVVVVAGGRVVVVVDVVDVVVAAVVDGAPVVDGAREVGDALGDVGGATKGATDDCDTTEVVGERVLVVVVDSTVVVVSSGASVDEDPEVESGG